MSGTFLGKFTFLSSNATGDQFYLTLVPGSGDPLLSFVSPTPVDWIAYDAGSFEGQQLLTLASPYPNALFLYYYDELHWVLGNANPSLPLMVVISPSTGAVMWQSLLAGALETGGYTMTTTFHGLVFPAPAGSGALTSMQCVQITPGLPAIKSTGSAAGMDFTGVDLTGASFAGIDCTGANFIDAILTGTDFSGANLAQAIFTGTDISGAKFGTNIQAVGAQFDNAIAAGAVFATDTTQPNTQADFFGANFSNADFSNVLFPAYTSASGSVTGANLSRATVFGANFSGASLPSANLTGLLAGQSSSGGNIGADFSRAFMPDANLVEADLDGADFSHAQLYFLASGALDSATVTNTNFSRADLTGMSFKGTTIMGVDFTGAILMNCTFNGVAFGPSPQYLPVSFVGAHLEGASFIGKSSLSQAHLADAYIAVASGVPLLVTPMAEAYATALKAGSVPAELLGVFSAAGAFLDPAAAVAAGTGSGTWTLTQNAVRQSVGVETTGYTLIVDGADLLVYASAVTLIEQSDLYTFSLVNLPVAATQLTAEMLDGATRCPNHSNLATNQLHGLTWEQMLTAPRVPLLYQGSLAIKWPRRQT
ncbi:MAG TPA: pentapeptide repeat-containing protein [Terracidiphilus sp.]|nr:pentapeptide repeat-containing protein [Terracidiphilus sp.]